MAVSSPMITGRYRTQHKADVGVAGQRKHINWANAKSYCENYRGGGYTDWRMPTQDELAGLYDANKSRPGACNSSYSIHTTELIDITCFGPWASETRVPTLPTSILLMAAGTGLTSREASAAGHSRYVLANRSFGSLIIFFFWVQGEVLFAQKLAPWLFLLSMRYGPVSAPSHIPGGNF